MRLGGRTACPGGPARRWGLASQRGGSLGSFRLRAGRVEARPTGHTLRSGNQSRVGAFPSTTTWGSGHSFHGGRNCSFGRSKLPLTDEIVEPISGGIRQAIHGQLPQHSGPYTRLIAKKVQTHRMTSFSSCFPISSRILGRTHTIPLCEFAGHLDFSQYVGAFLGEEAGDLGKSPAAVYGSSPVTTGKPSPLLRRGKKLLDSNLEWIDISQSQWVHPKKKTKVRIGYASISISSFCS